MSDDPAYADLTVTLKQQLFALRKEYGDSSQRNQEILTSKEKQDFI